MDKTIMIVCLLVESIPTILDFFIIIFTNKNTTIQSDVRLGFWAVVRKC